MGFLYVIFDEKDRETGLPKRAWVAVSNQLHVDPDTAMQALQIEVTRFCDNNMISHVPESALRIDVEVAKFGAFGCDNHVEEDGPYVCQFNPEAAAECLKSSSSYNESIHRKAIEAQTRVLTHSIGVAA
jgi:predicted ATP-grasp superfamily ATP-dependent carboligase